MRAWRLRVGEGPIERAMGSVLASDVRMTPGRVVLRKGTRLGPEHAEALAALEGVELHLVAVGPGELEQEVVARRLARAIARAGTIAEEPSLGQARVRATRRGLLRVRAETVRRINELVPLLLFTRPNGQVVLEGDEVAGAKSAALATAAEVVERAEALARAGPLEVAAFSRTRVAVVVTDRLEARGRAMVAEAVRQKIEWFGSELLGVSEVAHAIGAVRERLEAELKRGAELLLVSGANSLDPFDPVFEALGSLGGRLERAGVPAHPGSMVWLASLPGAPVLGIATCAGFGKDTALDLLLARVLVGETPTRAADELGHGGLVEGPTAAASFPPYERAGPTRIAEPAEA